MGEESNYDLQDFIFWHIFNIIWIFSGLIWTFSFINTISTSSRQKIHTMKDFFNQVS